MTVTRRTFLNAAIAHAAFQFLAVPAHAVQRATYGGTFRARLPISLARIDPHDPTSLAGSFLGSALFDTIYALTSDGLPYPALATSMPRRTGQRVEIELRSGLKFSNGRPLDGQAVAESIRRSQRLSPVLAPLGRPTTQSSKPHSVFFPNRSLALVARWLANPRSAIVERKFQPNAPVGCGAFRASRRGPTLRLERNERAARGGAFLDAAVFETAPIVDCLRAFEAKRSDLGFLGAGLHRPRRGVPKFQMKDLGLVVLRPGAELHATPGVGVLNEALARIPNAPLAALGVDRQRRSPRTWGTDGTTILVSREDPWLVSIAREIANSWTDSRRKISVQEGSAREVASRVRNKRYALHLSALSTSGMDATTISKTLFAVEGASAPLAGRALSPTEAARQLHLGVVGTLNPHGALDPKYAGTMRDAHLSLEHTQRTK